MSTLNSFIRSAAVAGRRAQRSHQRRTREAAKDYKSQLKQEAISSAAKAVDKYEEYIDVLKSVHKDVSDTVDWAALLNEAAPAEPVLSNRNEKAANAHLLAFKPSFLDKIFGTSRKKIEKLTKKVEVAKQIDQTDFNTLIRQHKESLEEQQTLKRIAKGILENDIHSYRDAMDYFKPFSEISELGSKMDIDFTAHSVTLHLQVNSVSIIPNYILSLTSTGKLSRKNMSATKFNELYQDYVCSCILRVARETLAYLPVNLVVVNAIGEIYNSATGITKEEVIVSVAISPNKLNEINFDLIDPSDSMKNFICNMKFGKTTGFTPVQKIEANNLIK